MGYDICYQALPDDCHLLQRAVNEPEFGDLLIWLHTLFQGRKPLAMLTRSLSPAEQEFLEEVASLKRAYPSIHYPTQFERRLTQGVL